jgi:hypothetical protein
MFSWSTAAGGLSMLIGLASAQGDFLLDPWDPGDETSQTRNALFHGTQQVHYLDDIPFFSSFDEDWYILSVRPFASYQVVVDGLTGDLDLTSSEVQRLNTQGLLVLESALVTDGGGVLTLNWQQGALGAPVTNFLRIRERAACGLLCDVRDSYRVRFYETTYTVPRFNNSGTQSTVLVLQNTTDRECNTSASYFDAAGTHVVTGPLTALAPYGLDVAATAAVAPGVSGSIRVTHTCGYGGLAGKAVSVEPSTGFTFDTALVPRPR